jgi:hypothetical protein
MKNYSVKLFTLNYTELLQTVSFVIMYENTLVELKFLDNINVVYNIIITFYIIIFPVCYVLVFMTEKC